MRGSAELEDGPWGDFPLLALHKASWGPYCGVPCSRGFRGSNQASSQPIFQTGTLRGPEACLGHCREEKSILAPGWGNQEGSAKTAPRAGRDLHPSVGTVTPDPEKKPIPPWAPTAN